MKTKLNLLAIGVFLTASVAGLGQSTVQFNVTNYAVAESAGAVTLIVERSNDIDSTVTVNYATVDGTATNGVKYTAGSGTLAFGAGETNKTLLLTILNNGFVDGTKDFQVILSNPTNAILGTHPYSTVSTTDNDVGVTVHLRRLLRC